ncbi:hypothetical protein AVEN_158275-1 [Araneus ventricosus]|uniref:Uncharacterized protein n=1 Tax=Araneus ventricosus TaxID=182803 RepID=A0A4Y2PXY0_ARAVE|nr:hypothetical protein AVEN_158275-1 [Araneus ventricosus]
MSCFDEAQYASPIHFLAFECQCPLLCPLQLPKNFFLLSGIHRDAASKPVSPFQNLSSHESCQSVRKGDVVQSSNGCDSGLLLEVENRNSKYDLERRGCCGSVCS